ncbi:hypothetical protein RclHR1_40840001, partial [Rhizophagus clarus]
VNGKKGRKPLANTTNLQKEIIEKSVPLKSDSSAPVAKKRSISKVLDVPADVPLRNDKSIDILEILKTASPSERSPRIIGDSINSETRRPFRTMKSNSIPERSGSMLPEIDKTELLSSSIAKLSAENDIIKAENNKIKAENDKIRAENTELKARIAKLEDMQTQNELIKNLLSISQKILT